MAHHPDGPTPPPKPDVPGPPPLPTNRPTNKLRPPKDEPSVYNVVTDVATGPNIRKKDNLFQALFILVCLAIAIPVAWALSGHWIGGVFVGGLVGLVVGVLLSGGFLMIYRLFKH